MARLETSAIVWLAVLGAGILGIVGVGGYAAYRLITQPDEHVEEAVAVTSPPPPPVTSVPQPGAAALTPRYTAQDAERLPDEAYRDLWVGIARGDAAVAMKYVPAAKLREMTSGEQVLDSFLGLSPVEDVRVAKGMTSGTKAVLFVKASSPTITDAHGHRSPIDVVVRMVQEDGHWKVDQQIWLVATEPEEHQASAMAWLKGR
jgi:hypothetical protein